MVWKCGELTAASQAFPSGIVSPSFKLAQVPEMTRIFSRGSDGGGLFVVEEEKEERKRIV